MQVLSCSSFRSGTVVSSATAAAEATAAGPGREGLGVAQAGIERPRDAELERRGAGNVMMGAEEVVRLGRPAAAGVLIFEEDAALLPLRVDEYVRDGDVAVYFFVLQGEDTGHGVVGRNLPAGV